MTAWRPRPRAVGEPACWSWPVPPVRTAAEIGRECALIVEAMASRPPDERLDADMVNDVYGGDPRQVRWREFHDGQGTFDGWLSGRRYRRCAGCGRRDRVKTDHDHRTGLERGELCHGCNVAEGSRYSGGSAWARLYRATNPASILGHVRYYFGPFGWDDNLWWEDVEGARRLTGNPDWQPIEGGDW